MRLGPFILFIVIAMGGGVCAGIMGATHTTKENCHAAGHFVLNGQAYLCRPIGELAELHPLKPTISGSAK